MDQIRTGKYAEKPWKASGTLRVFDWNIDRGHDLARVSAALASERPDLAILQEVDLDARRTQRRDIAAELAKSARLNYVFAPEFRELSQGTDDQPAYHGQAILTSLPILRTRVIRFASQSGFWKPHAYLPAWPMFQRRLGGRIALIAELQIPGHKLVVYNLHLESRSAGEIQMAQLEEVLRDAAQYPEQTPILIAGDLNTKYRACTAAVLARLKKAGYENAAGDAQPRTHIIVGSLDWIFARGPVHFATARVHRELHGSDHFPVSAQMVLSSGPARM
jgi:endonuclease/exonuclease/phosphatase family metal-dependent hydrolase